MTSTVHVVGGGVAGLAAALSLREHGRSVRLYEAHRHLGGRVFSTADRVVGAALDNGPHVMLGCYDAMRWLLRAVGTEDRFDQAPQLALSYRWSGGRSARLGLSRLPIPLSMPAALLGWKALTMRQRWAALRGMLASQRRAPSEWTVAEWLRRKGQQGVPAAVLWRPLCLAIMNAEPAEVAAESFLVTLRRAFGGSAAGGAIWIPQAPWQELVGDPAGRALAAAGVECRLATRIESLVRSDTRVVRLSTNRDDIELEDADEVLLAVPWKRSAQLLPELAAFGDFAPRAIANLAFASDEEVATQHVDQLAILVDGAPFQFVYGTRGLPRRLTLIAGAPPQPVSAPELIEAGRSQLLDFCPELGAWLASAQPRLTMEAAATFLAAPGVDQLRPTPGRVAGLGNVAVCGDWTATGLPATLEGAADSGRRAAADLVRSRGSACR